MFSRFTSGADGPGSKIAQIERDKKSALCFDTNQLGGILPRLLGSNCPPRLRRDEEICCLTFFRLVVAVLAVVAVVVEDALVVVVLALAGDTAVIVAGLVVLVAVEPVLLQSVAVAGNQLPLAGDALEAVEVENPVSGAHHVIAFAKGVSALITFCSKETNVVFLAIRLAVPHKAGAVLVQEHLTLVALKSK